MQLFFIFLLIVIFVPKPSLESTSTLSIKQPLYTTKANLERSGMGFTIMESFMDDVEVESVLGLGTKITMRRKIKSNSQKEEFATATIRGEE